MKKSCIIYGIIILMMFGRCSVKKDYQGKITKDFTTIAGASGKFKNDSLFRKTTVTLSTYSEFISLYNLQKKTKPVDKRYTTAFYNYVIVLDTLSKSVQNNTTGYEKSYSKSMDYIQNDVKDKFFSQCPACPVQQYQPVLVDVKINITAKNGNEGSGYHVYMEPAFTYGSEQQIRLGKSNSLKRVVPGYYKIWIEKAGKIVSEKNEHIKNQNGTAVINFVI